MAKRAKTKSIIPDFKSEREAADWYASHSAAEFWDELKPARPITLPPEQIQAIRDRHKRRKSTVSIRFDPDQIAQARRIAERKSIGYQAQIRLWIDEAIRRESSGRSA
jgi:hypothetical protein